MTTYHVEVMTPGVNRTDFTTRSLHNAAARRLELDRRGLMVVVKTGSGRPVLDVDGDTPR